MDIEKIRSKINTVQGQQVILDYEVASLYGVQTKEVNQAVRNNPDKFPEGYIITLTKNGKAGKSYPTSFAAIWKQPKQKRPLNSIWLFCP